MGDSTPPTDARNEPIAEALRAVIASCDAEILARQLGLGSAAAAQMLRDDPSALTHLSARMADGCVGLSADEATSLARQILGGPDNA